MDMMDARLELMKAWLPKALASAGTQVSWTEPPQGTLAPASTDASFRRYFRLQSDDRCLIIMDAPPPQEDVRPFMRIASLLADAGVRVPRILAADPERGFLLLEDMGRDTYLQSIQAGLPAVEIERLFGAAIEALLAWQQASRPGVLPDYADELLLSELNLFPDWFVERHLDRVLSPEQIADWEQLCQLLLDSIGAEARVFVHRDFMPRNLMTSAGQPGVLDFQDALYGPVSYDATSLFADAFFSFSPAERQQWLHRYWQRAREVGVPVPERVEAFLDQSRLMGVQRHLKVLGIFARIRYRDGKPHYLEDAPRFIRYLREACAQDQRLAPLQRLLDSLGLPRLEALG
ncbi:aminoglycoside phosphotransferase [Halopseudomonas phragmitis]|uniref:Aminoglycoside phosphotransferase n=2 Tax=Halopseudomonas phragmitis TaxID=1931241 RepID=A0A1V0B3N5_9GAMM|nr:aminoglycoside phosphotransferase [Halopseudomonas phragmitis]